MQESYNGKSKDPGNPKPTNQSKAKGACEDSSTYHNERDFNGESWLHKERGDTVPKNNGSVFQTLHEEVGPRMMRALEVYHSKKGETNNGPSKEINQTKCRTGPNKEVLALVDKLEGEYIGMDFVISPYEQDGGEKQILPLDEGKGTGVGPYAREEKHNISESRPMTSLRRWKKLARSHAIPAMSGSSSSPIVRKRKVVEGPIDGEGEGGGKRGRHSGLVENHKEKIQAVAGDQPRQSP